ncbi:MAG: DUF4364 family protein [Clostridia bacterium]|nr:DUF4364 family protein [Clostridia bacterium]
MAERLFKRDDIKIFILYILNCLKNPATYEDINEIVISDDIVAGIDFADCFADLLEAGNISETKSDGVALYGLTLQGRQVIDSLQNDISKTVRTQGMRTALRLQNFRERGSVISTSYSLRDDGKYNLNCTIIDDRQLSLDLTLVVESPNQLELMMHNFDRSPESIYRGIVALLSGDLENFLSN